MSATIPSWLVPSIGKPLELLTKISAVIPVLEGERVTLRAPRIEDYELYGEIMTGERAALLGGPMSEAESWRDFTQAVSGWLLRGFGLFSIEYEGALTGFIFLHHEYPDPDRELGWILSESAEGKGIAYEAAKLALDYAHAQGFTSLVSYIEETNDKSAQLAERLGAVRDGGHPEFAGDRVYHHQMGGAA